MSARSFCRFFSLPHHKERDDTNWLVHSLSWLENNGNVRMGKRPVNMNTLTNHIQPIPLKKRVY